MKNLVLSAVVGALMFAGSAAYAEEGKSEEKAEKKNEVLVAAEEFMAEMDEISKRHFSVLYGNYNLIKVVETVRDDVEMAVEACGEANPDMEEPLETRFDVWKDAVKPVLKEADANVNNMILAQDYSKPRDIKKFLKKIDKARDEQDDRVKKVPVTSVEACQSLLEKMDETEANMVRLLEMTLVSLPMTMKAEDEAARAKAAEEAAKKAEEEARKKAVEKDAPQDL